MLDFSNDINFLQANVNIDFNNLNLSQKVQSEKLLYLLAKKYNIKPEQIETFNGYSSAIYSILKFLKLKRCFIYSPIHEEYKNACENLSYDLRVINRFENLFLPIKDESVVVFMNPSFLDGTYYDLDELVKYWILKEASIIIDETFLDFCNKESALKYLESYNKVYILKAMNRYFGNKSLNISTIFSSLSNIKELKAYEPSNKLSVFDVKYLEESLLDTKFKSVTNAVMIKNRFAIEEVLNKCEYIEFLFQSSSNSLLIKPRNITSIELKQKFEEAGVGLCIYEEYIYLYLNSQNQIQKLEEVLDAF